MLSASFRHGMTTDTLGWAPRSAAPWAARRVVSVALTSVLPPQGATTTEGPPRRGPMVAEALCDSAWRADLRRIRLPLPPYRRGGRALVPESRRTPGSRGARGHLSDTAAMGRGRARPTRGCDRSPGRTAHVALHPRGTPTDRAAGRLRRGRRRASRPARARL